VFVATDKKPVVPFLMLIADAQVDQGRGFRAAASLAPISAGGFCPIF